MKLLVAGLLGLTLSANSHAQTASRIAFDIRSESTGEIVAKGIENSRTDGLIGVREAVYLAPDGRPRQTESCRFAVKTGRLAGYSFADSTTGESVDVRADDAGQSIFVRYREDGTSAWREGTVDWGPTATHGKLLPDLILTHWDELAHGGRVDADLLVPARLETFGYQISYQAAQSAASGEETFLAEARSWFIRQFAPTFTFKFSTGLPRQILSYTGPSPVQIEGKRYQRIVSSFVAIQTNGAAVGAGDQRR